MNLMQNIIDELLTKAKKAGLNSYSPYSKFRVGAAVLTKDDKTFVGTNVENRSYGATICAEQSAITNTITNGCKYIKAICIVGLDSDEPLAPCGICRQIISEFGMEVTVIMADKELNYEISDIKSLFPKDLLRDL